MHLLFKELKMTRLISITLYTWIYLFIYLGIPILLLRLLLSFNIKLPEFSHIIAVFYRLHQESSHQNLLLQ